MVKKLEQIANHYGFEVQSNQLIEEMAELTQALNKYKRYGIIENIIEEIADVEVMLEQIKILLAIPQNSIDSIKEEKIDRQIKRISKE